MKNNYSWADNTFLPMKSAVKVSKKRSRRKTRFWDATDTHHMLPVVECYTLAANQGYARAQCNLGLCFKNGTGISKDRSKAVHWLMNAANQGHNNAILILEWSM
jgi:TPR repeat protein